MLLVVTDGEDNTSHNSLDKAIKEVQKTDTVIYTIGLLERREQEELEAGQKGAGADLRRLRADWRFFRRMWMTCTISASRWRTIFATSTRWRTIRPTRSAMGRFASVQVEVIPPRGRGKLVARTQEWVLRTGWRRRWNSYWEVIASR